MRKLLLSLVLGGFVTLGQMVSASDVKAVTDFDSQRYLGQWYEIARLPNFFQEKCVGDIAAQYHREGEGIAVVNRCRVADGKMDVATGFATLENSSGSELKVSFLPRYLRWIPFTKGDYWVLRIDPDYQISLVGDPDRKYLWLLSRTPTLPAEVIKDYLNSAKAMGYQLDNIIYTQNSVGDQQ
mgnify:CR=1 FL=1